MNPATFELRLFWVGPYFRESSLHHEVATQPERLYVHLRHLVTGAAHITIGHTYRLSSTKVGRILRETTQVICNCLVEKGHMSSPISHVNGAKFLLNLQKIRISRVV